MVLHPREQMPVSLRTTAVQIAVNDLADFAMELDQENYRLREENAQLRQRLGDEELVPPRPFAEARQLTVGELLTCLREVADQGREVVFDFCGFAPGFPHSWRGYYHHLALDFADEDRHTKVKDLVFWLESSLQYPLEGYKGGSFQMTIETPVWVSRYGREDLTTVIGVHTTPEYAPVVIRTGWKEQMDA